MKLEKRKWPDSTHKAEMGRAEGSQGRQELSGLPRGSSSLQENSCLCFPPIPFPKALLPSSFIFKFKGMGVGEGRIALCVCVGVFLSGYSANNSELKQGVESPPVLI